jgi:preprotein translocase subunit SecG
VLALDVPPISRADILLALLALLVLIGGVVVLVLLQRGRDDD